jgi:hypothetical protein
MPQISQRNFTGGELAPELHSRTDISKYQNGLGKCENFIVKAQGGLDSRPGTRYIDELADSTKRGRLIPFSFNTEQTYILVFEESSIRFIKNGAYIKSGGTPVSIVTTYRAEDLSRITFTQSADVLTICHPNYPPAKLSRLSDTNWTLTAINYAPTVTTPTIASSKPKPTPGTTTISNADPAVVITAAAHGFANGDIVTLDQLVPDEWKNVYEERWFYVRNKTTTSFNLSTTPDGDLLDGTEFSAGVTSVSLLNGPRMFGTYDTGSYTRSYEYVVSAVDADGVESLPSTIGRFVNVPVLTETRRARLVINDVPEADYYRVYKSPSGLDTGTWGWIGDTRGPTFDDNNIAPLTSDAPKEDRQPFASPSFIIIGVTNANPAVVTTSIAHSFSNNDRVTIKDVGGMTELNGRAFFVDNVTSTTFELVGEDSTLYGTYSTAGTVFKSMDFPQTVTYHQQRQIFANTYNEPQTIYTTQIGNFNSLRKSRPTRDDDAITITINARQVNEIRHLVPLTSLVVLTSSAEWLVTEGENGLFTPSTVGVQVQSYNGSSWVRPVTIDNNILYVQENGKKIRDMGFQWQSDSYVGNDLSIMSNHLFEDYTIEEMAYAAEPYGVVWCVRDDGSLLGLTYQREHQVWAWHRHTTGPAGIRLDNFESVATIKEDGRDATYVIVKRLINGVTKRYIERLEPRDLSDAPLILSFSDSFVRYTGSPVTTVTGLGHLEGETVSILADGVVNPQQTVVSGQITLPREASNVTVGLAYTPAIETLDIDSVQQPLKGSEIAVDKVIIEVLNSRGGWVGPVDNDGNNNMLEIKPRFDDDGYDAIALKTYKPEIYIQPEWSKGGRIRIEQRDPLPLSITSIIPNVTIGGI